MKVNYRKYDNRYIKDHPRFGTGVFGLHRVKIYEKYGENLPDCEVCGKPVFWDSCHIDHIDNNPQNNEIENLRPLHRGCNTSRQGRYVNKYMQGTLPYEAMIRGFVSCKQAAEYCGMPTHQIKALYKQNPDEVIRLYDEAKMKMDKDDNAVKFTAKQRYDMAMNMSGYIRIQGWIKPENKAAVQAFFETKAGLDYETGEHLIKKGEKRAKK